MDAEVLAHLQCLPLHVEDIRWTTVNDNFNRSAAAVNELYELIRQLQRHAAAGERNLLAQLQAADRERPCPLEPRFDLLESTTGHHAGALKVHAAKLEELHVHQREALDGLSQSHAKDVAVLQSNTDRQARELEARLTLLIAEGRCRCDMDRVAALESAVSGRLDALERQAKIQDERDNQLRVWVDGRVNTLRSDIAAVRSRVESLEDKLATVAEGAQKARVDVDAFTPVIEGLKLEIDGIDGKAERLRAELVREIDAARNALTEMPKLLAALERREADDTTATHRRIDAVGADVQRALRQMTAAVATFAVKASDEPLMRKSACLSCDFTSATVPGDRRPATQVARAPAGMAPAAVLRLRASRRTDTGGDASVHHAFSAHLPTVQAKPVGAATVSTAGSSSLSARQSDGPPSPTRFDLIDASGSGGGPASAILGPFT